MLVLVVLYAREVCAMSVSPASIGQVAVPVRDLERATGFYRDVLGLPFLFAAPPGLAFFRCGEVRIMLSTPEDESGGAPLLYYRVQDVDGAHASLVEADTEVVREPSIVHRDESMELWIGAYRDSESNLFCVMEERAPAGAPEAPAP